MHVAGDQLQLRVGVARAGLVDDADPGADVHAAAVGVRAFGVGDVVVRPPGHALGLVRHAGAVRAAALCVDVPDQRRARDQAAGQRRQLDAGVVRHDLHAAVVAPEHEPTLRRQQRAVEGLGRLAAHLFDRDRAVDVLLQQLLGADQVELVVLLEHGGALAVGQRLEHHGGRIDQRGDVGEAHRVASLVEVEVAFLAHDRVAGHGARGPVVGTAPATRRRARRGCRSSARWPRKRWRSSRSKLVGR